MTYFIIFLGGVLGLTNILTRAKLLKTSREWLSKKSELLGYLTGCHMCIGFWSGLFVYLLMYYELYIIPSMFAGSYVCWFMNKIYLKYFR